MPRATLHGVPISWSRGAPPPDLLAAILEPLGPILESEDPLSGGLALELREAPPSAADRPELDGFTPAFYIGIIQAYRGEPRRAGGAAEAAPVPTPLLFWNRASRVYLPFDGSPIEALIAPPSREVIPGSTAEMLHIALSLALRREGLFHLHAAAVVHPSGASIVIAGGSGAGKTTTTIALIEAGCAYLSDDALFLRRADQRAEDAALELLAFPREFHVGPATLGAFPRLAGLAQARVGHPSKLGVDPRQAFPDRSRLTCPPPSIVLFPSVTSSATTETTPLSRADALGQLIASSAAIFMGDIPGRAENIAALRSLVGSADAFELRLGSDFLQSPVEALLPLLESALEGVKRAR